MITLGRAAMWGLFYEFYEQDQILATYERTQGKIHIKSINDGKIVVALQIRAGSLNPDATADATKCSAKWSMPVIL